MWSCELEKESLDIEGKLRHFHGPSSSAKMRMPWLWKLFPHEASRVGALGARQQCCFCFWRTQVNFLSDDVSWRTA